MNDSDLMEFIKVWNDAQTKPDTAMGFLLFMDKNGFGIYRKQG